MRNLALKLRYVVASNNRPRQDVANIADNAHQVYCEMAHQNNFRPLFLTPARRDIVRVAYDTPQPRGQPLWSRLRRLPIPHS